LSLNVSVSEPHPSLQGDEAKFVRMRVRLCDAGAVEPLLDIIGTAGPAVSREALLSLGCLVAPVEAIKAPPPSY
jgi:hypothetical protein